MKMEGSTPGNYIPGRKGGREGEGSEWCHGYNAGRRGGQRVRE